MQLTELNRLHLFRSVIYSRNVDLLLLTSCLFHGL